MNLLRKSGPLGHFWTIILLQNVVCYRRKLNDIGRRLEHTTEISEMPCTTERQLNAVTSHSYEAA
jgi:hypothetical protein